MKVFISWSGRRSHEVADALAGWLKKVIQSAEPWVSSDMERGVKWLAEIGKSLDAHSIGILCVTPGNVKAPWLNFEAGALSKQIGDEVRVIPYLLDFRSSNELQPPLGQFNASLANEQGTFELVKTLNAHSETQLTEIHLDETFKMWWPKLREKLESIRTSGKGQLPERRSMDDKVDEILSAVREFGRNNISDTALAAAQVLGIVEKYSGTAGRELRRPGGHIELGGGSAGGAMIRGEGTLSVGSPPSPPPYTSEETAAEVVAMMLRQSGLDVSAMSVMKVVQNGIWVYVPHSIHNSVLQKVRTALQTTLPDLPAVAFFTGQAEMQQIDPDREP